jgi:hypothetical protein
LDAWIEDILFPSLAADAPPEAVAAFDQVAKMSKFFGGTPKTGGEAQVETGSAPLPKVEMPAAPAAPFTRKKKKKRGC